MNKFSIQSSETSNTIAINALEYGEKTHSINEVINEYRMSIFRYFIRRNAKRVYFFNSLYLCGPCRNIYCDIRLASIQETEDRKSNTVVVGTWGD